MKIIQFLLLFTFIICINASGQSDNKLLKTIVKIEKVESTIQEILDVISQKYGIVFSYDPADINLSKIVKLNTTTKELGTFLDEIFRDSNIEFKLHANVIILRKIENRQAKRKRVTISGIIKDINSSESLIGSYVYSTDTKTGDIANQYGFYSLTIPEGQNLIQFSCVGYETFRLDTVLNADLRYDIKLTPSIVEVNEVVVTEKQNKLADFKQGFSRIDMKSVKSLPSIFGETDLLKNVLLLPGVNSTSEIGGNFQVRGGSWDQNLMLLDEAIVYNSNHLFGIYSTYNPDIIKDVKFFKAGIPAFYGGRVSSVMDVTQKEGDMNSFHTDGSIGIITSRLTVEGPIIKEKSSFVVSARRSLIEPYMKYVNNDNTKNMRPYFFDLNAKINYIINPNNRLYLSAYAGFDQMDMINTEKHDYGNITTTLRYNHIFNERMFSNTSLIFSQYNMSVTSTSDTTYLTAKLGLEHYEFKNDFNYRLLRHKFRFGVQSIFYVFHPGNIIPSVNNLYTKKTLLDDLYSLQSALYFDDIIKLSDRFELQVGLRFSNFNCLGKADVYKYVDGEPRSNEFIIDTVHYKNGEMYQTYNNLEPRLSLKFLISDNQSIVASYNRMVQYVQLISRTFSPQPYDIWKPSNNYIKPLTADQFSLGWFYNLHNTDINLSIESYYKFLSNVNEVKVGAQTNFNTNLDASILQGTGNSYGLEFSVSKNRGDFTGSFSYTYSRSFREVDGKFVEEKVNLGRTYPTDYDIPHKVNISGEYAVSKRLSLTANFVYQTGRPVSYPTGQFYYMNNLMSYYSGKNQYRYSDFHHLDLGAILKNRTKPNRKWQSSWTFSIYNVYNHENEYYNGIRYKNDGSRNTEAVSMWIFNVVPAISYNFKF